MWEAVRHSSEVWADAAMEVLRLGDGWFELRWRELGRIPKGMRRIDGRPEGEPQVLTGEWSRDGLRLVLEARLRNGQAADWEPWYLMWTGDTIIIPRWRHGPPGGESILRQIREQ